LGCSHFVLLFILMCKHGKGQGPLPYLKKNSNRELNSTTKPHTPPPNNNTDNKVGRREGWPDQRGKNSKKKSVNKESAQVVCSIVSFSDLRSGRHSLSYANSKDAVLLSPIGIISIAAWAIARQSAIPSYVNSRSQPFSKKTSSLSQNATTSGLFLRCFSSHLTTSGVPRGTVLLPCRMTETTYIGGLYSHATSVVNPSHPSDHPYLKNGTLNHCWRYFIAVWK